MKKALTIFLRLLLFLFGLVVVALAIFALPAIWRDAGSEYPTVIKFIHLIVLGMYATTIPFFIGLAQTFKLLNYLDKDIAFSELSVKALRIIKICAIVISVLYVAGVPLLFPLADVDDAPGMLVLGALVACAPIAIAIFATILEKLLHNAIKIKKENDLTV